VAANFWTNGINSADLISVNDKSSVITWERSTNILIGISDPTQTNKNSITVTLNRSAASLASADPGVTVMQLSPQIILSVNLNGSLGKTFQASFNYAGAMLPAITALYPNGTNLFQSTNTLGFTVASAVGVATNNIVVTVNGVAVTNLVFSGSTNNWNVSYPHLQPNSAYAVTVSVMDANGNVTTASSAFDTFSAANYTWEAEDFDYNNGHFIDNSQTNAYAGLSALANVDTHQVNFAGVYLYRPNGMDTETNGDFVRPPYSGTGRSDYSIGYFSAGSWANYTRHYPVGNYYLYARLAAGSGATTCILSQVTGGWGTTTQTTNLLGTFSVANTAWESYNLVPLKDAFGNLATLSFNGSTNTLQFGRPGSATADCNANFLMIVPVFAANAISDGTNLNIAFPTQSGFNYQVQYKNNLQDAVWLPLGAPVVGNDTVQSIPDPLANARFYRVVIQ
jgi:hypothetical protein